MKKKTRIHYAWFVLVAVSLIRGVAGPAVNASSGVFMTPVSQSLGIGIGQLSLYLSVSSVVTLVWLPVAGTLFQKYPVKLVAALGVALQALAFTGLGFVKSVWGFYVLAVPLAMGAALLVNLLGPVLVNRWFSKNAGLIMGIMMMITSLLGSVFQPVLTALIDRTGWRETYISFGLFALIFMLVISLLLLKDKPEDKGLLPYGERENNGEDKGKSAGEPAGIPSKKALKSMAFFSLFLFMIVITGFASFQQHVATFGLGMGLTMADVGKALSISMIGASIGSVLIGICSDRLGIIKTSMGVLFTGVVAVGLFFFSSRTAGLFLAATFLHGLATSSIGVVAPLLTRQFFGNLDYEKLFSMVMIGSPLASIVLMPAYGFIYDTYGSYNLVFLFLIFALAAAAAGLWSGVRSSRKLSA